MSQSIFYWLWIAIAIVTVGAIFYGFWRNVGNLYWKVFVCLLPVLVSGIIVGQAAAKYRAGEGGFKLGVDLVGGTILVYEIDPDKKPKDFKPEQLAAALKRRIDPADLYNVTIRPVGDTRVEIILPTGGAYQSQMAENAWKEVVDKVKDRFKDQLPPDAELDAPRGDTAGLVRQTASKIDQNQWNNLLQALPGEFPKLKGKEKELSAIPEGHTEELLTKFKDAAGADEAKLKSFIDSTYHPTKIDEIDAYVKQIYTPSLQRKDVSGEEVQRIKDKIAMVGSLEFRILANQLDDKEVFAVEERYFADAASNPDIKRELEKAAKDGEPPPVPKNPDGEKDWKLGPNTNREQTRTNYAWMEVGRQERWLLGLDNASESGVPAKGSSDESEGKRQRYWPLAAQARQQGKPLVLPGYGQTLLYSRPCENINLSAEERGEKKYDYFFLTRLPERDEATGEDLAVTGQDLTDAFPKTDDTTGKLEVAFQFNSHGAYRMQKLTSQNTPGSDENKYPRHMAIILDGQIMSAPTINTTIRDAGRITGEFSKREIDQLVGVLRAGALPATLKREPVSEQTLGATLGADTIRKGMWAIFYAFLAVLVFMCAYYRFAGFVASVALLANLLLTVAFMVFVNATFTLPGLAGLVLTLGMAVDANVLIYERLREERDKGANILLALRNGYDRALPTIIDTHLTSIFTAIVLYVVGNDQLKGFGVSLTVGLAISLFTSLFVTRTIFTLWTRLNLLTELSMVRFLTRPSIDFMKIRYYWFTATIVLTIVGLAVFLWRGEKSLDIDFVGGTAYGGQLTEGRLLSNSNPSSGPLGLRQLLDTERQTKLLKVASVKQVGDDPYRYQITYAGEGSPTAVTFRNLPDGPTVREREQNVAERASQLPDVKVTQIFPRDEPSEGGRSRHFDIRTTEREPELVQVVIDRLLSNDENGKLVSLQQSARIKNFSTPKGGKSDLEFSDYASRGYLKTLIARELKDMGIGEMAFNVNGKGKPKAELYKDMTVEFSSDKMASLAAENLKSIIDKSADKLPAPVKKSELRYDETRGSQVVEVTFAVPITPAELEKTLDADVSAGLGQAGLKVKATPVDNPVNGKNVIFTIADADAKTQDALGENVLSRVLKQVQEEFDRRPQPERLENFDAQLAKKTQGGAAWAIILSWLVILGYLWFRFGSWTFGAATVLCLMHDLFFTLGIIAFCHYIVAWAPGFAGLLGLEDFKIDFTAVAALLTLVGYSVSDTIVVFDRIREVRGKNPLLTAQTINDSVNQTLSRTLLSSTTVFLVVFVLYVWGGEGVHLFAFVMVIGVVVGTYSSIYIASPLLLIFGEGAPPKKAVAPKAPAPAGTAV
ncbi:MAG TPA: protein translocase subunit SecD [Gemmataceae bacterium]|nr:protein translocase subunit SecD [Gemmataceae bacterium]